MHLRKSAEYETVVAAEMAFYRRYLRPEMVVFDVGANVGELTALFGRLAGEVHAFEPSPRSFAVLAGKELNARLNQVAVSDHEGETTFYDYDAAHSEFSGLGSRALEGLPEPVAISVPVTTLDHYCAGIPRIDLLKIDVEGYELQVMRGAATLLQERRIACVVFEYGGTTIDAGNTAEEMRDYLMDQGYGIRNIVRSDRLFPRERRSKAPRYSMHLAYSFQNSSIE